MAELLGPYLAETAALAYTGPAPDLLDQLSAYLELLLRWNQKTNLTAVRSPAEIVQRHFGESLFAARCLAPVLLPSGSLLDFGSGAGFPGLPIQLWRPDISVVLAEAQSKKAAFLREATRVLGVPAEVWPRRVEAMPGGRRFDVVTLRAVDRMSAARREAAARVVPGGVLCELTGAASQPGLADSSAVFPVPLSSDRIVRLCTIPAQPPA